MDGLLTIGEFALRSGLSRSALRFYDQNALLRPRLVDQETSYRFYALEQVEDALLVRQLRAAEMSVGLVREFLEASLSERVRILDQHKERFRARLQAADLIAAGVNADLARGARSVDERWCTISSGEFAQALELVQFAAASPEDRPELAVVWVEVRDQSLRLVTTDSFRLAVRDVVPTATGGGSVSGAIDIARARELAKGLGGDGSLMLWQGRDGSLGTSVDGNDALIGGTRSEFPDYERILSELPTGHQATVEHADFEQALASVPDEHEHIVMRVTATTVALETGDRQASTPASWSGQDTEVWLDRRFFSQAVRATVGPDLAIEVIDPLQPVTLRSADTGTFNVLTMPVRPPVTP